MSDELKADLVDAINECGRRPSSPPASDEHGVPFVDVAGLVIDGACGREASTTAMPAATMVNLEGPERGGNIMSLSSDADSLS
jgi:hypothetical protein